MRHFGKNKKFFYNQKVPWKGDENNAYGTGTTYSTSTYRTNAVFYMKGKS